VIDSHHQYLLEFLIYFKVFYMHITDCPRCKDIFYKVSQGT